MQSIELKRITDEEGDRNRGWQVDQVEAWLGGIQVGYLKISYIPRKRFKDHYRSGILSYLSEIGGHHLFDRPKGGVHDRENHHIPGFTDDQLRAFVRRGAWIFLRVDCSMTDATLLMTRPELMAMVDKITARAEAQHSAEFRAFKAFHVDTPLVDFIRVEEDWRHRGIATAMCVEGARWMDSLGMKLHRSGVESEDGQGLFDRLTQEGWTTTRRGGRRFLDVAKIAAISKSDGFGDAKREAASAAA